MSELLARKAVVSDAKEIAGLLNGYADKGELLPRTAEEVVEHIRDFVVLKDNGKVIGCSALSIQGEDIAEVRSLAIRSDYKGQGLGKQLVLKCHEEAKDYGIDKVFALTYVPNFFLGMGYKLTEKENFPHKIWKDCLKCEKFPNCDEIAVIIELQPH